MIGKRVKLWGSAVLAALLCVGMTGCYNRTNLPEDHTDEPTERVEAETRIDYIYEVKSSEVELYPEEDRASWREPLIKLLANACVPVREENGDGEDYLPPDPNSPSIGHGYSVGLFDFDFDGVPEVVVDHGGGSAGNASYGVYDLMTGEELCHLDGGHNQIFGVYFNRDTGEYEVILRYQWRNGWMGRSTFITRVEHGEAADFSGKALKQTNLIVASYHINALTTEPTEEQTDQGISGDWIEYCSGVSFYVNGKETTVDEYLNECARRDTYCMLIPETCMQEVSWSDVTADGDDATTRATKMADALLSSGQRYVKP